MIKSLDPNDFRPSVIVDKINEIIEVVNGLEQLGSVDTSKPMLNYDDVQEDTD